MHTTKRSSGPFLVLGSKLKLIANDRNLIAKLGKNWGVSWGIATPQSSVKASLVVQNKICAGTELDIEFDRIRLLCFIHRPDLFFSPCFCISDTVGFADIFFGAKTFNNKIFVFTINVYSFFHIIRC